MEIWGWKKVHLSGKLKWKQSQITLLNTWEIASNIEAVLSTLQIVKYLPIEILYVYSNMIQVGKTSRQAVKKILLIFVNFFEQGRKYVILSKVWLKMKLLYLSQKLCFIWKQGRAC